MVGGESVVGTGRERDPSGKVQRVWTLIVSDSPALSILYDIGLRKDSAADCPTSLRCAAAWPGTKIAHGMVWCAVDVASSSSHYGMVWYGMVDVCDGYLAAEASGSSFG